MRLLWWRSKYAKDTRNKARAKVPTAASARAGEPTPSQEVKDTLLRFARDYFLARGARVRIEDADLLSAQLPDGSTVRYTTSLARTRQDEQCKLLVEGGGALAEMVAASTAEARVVALSLAPVEDAVTLARRAIAAPVPGCGHCVGRLPGSEDATAHCEACPLRDGRYLFAGLEEVRAVRETRRWDSWCVELVFHVVARDRQGRLDDTLRLAFDAEVGTPLPPLTESALDQAKGVAVPTDAPAWLEAAVRHAQAPLTRCLNATAAFLRLRSGDEYARRRDEIRATFTALQRRQEGSPSALKRALDGELRRLGEVYGVEVEASLASVAFVQTPLAAMTLTGAKGRELAVTLDLGRAAVQPPTCSSCAQPCRAGAVCQQGHVTCPTCRLLRDGGTACLACAQDNSATDTQRARRPAARSAISPERFTVEALDALLPHAWHACVRWLLERDGMAIDSTQDGPATLVCSGTRADNFLIASALRLPEGWRLAEREVHRAASAAARPGASALLISPAVATDAARREALRLDLVLWDQQTLAALLDRHATAYEREWEARRRHVEERIALAIAARSQALAALEALEGALAASAPIGDRLRTQSQVVTAAATITAAHADALRALLAWETLAADFTAAFGERTARDGGLEVIADREALREQERRAAHLHDAALGACRLIGEQPASGPGSYTAWRGAVIAELTARCEAVRWRLLALDPAKWQDFSAAHDTQAAAQAEAALTAASHAAARAEKAFGQLARGGGGGM